MTFDFSHLEIKQATAWIDLSMLSPGASVQLRPATESNKPYNNAMLRLGGSRIRKMARTDKIDPNDSAKNREEDRMLFPKHVMIGWRGIQDTNKQEVPFTTENAVEFCEKIPTWVFDKIRNFASSPENFVQDDDPEPDAAELAGNLSGG